MPENERERIEQSNDVAGIVIDVFGEVWPSTHADLSLRYGIADAIWAAGYRRSADVEVGSHRG